MRIREAIEMIDRLMPNQYGEDDKVHWLGELDGIADREVFRAHEREEDMTMEALVLLFSDGD